MATKVIDKMVTEGDLYSNISIICKGVSSLKASPRLLRIWQSDTDRSPPSLYRRSHVTTDFGKRTGRRFLLESMAFLNLVLKVRVSLQPIQRE